MNWVVSLILWLSILPVLPIVYVSMRSEAKFKKNLAVGVTFPAEAREDARVQDRLARFKKEQGWVALALLLVVVPCLWIKDIGMTMFAWGVWIILAIVLPSVVYARCNHDLHRIKEEGGWNRAQTDVVLVDTQAITEVKWLSPWAFAPAVALCLLPIFWERILIWVYVLDALCAILCWAGYRGLYRNKAEAVDGNIAITRALDMLRRRNWGRMWLYAAYMLAAINLAAAYLVKHPALSLALILLLSLTMLVAAMQIELATRRAQEKLTAQSGREWYVDEDDKWIWGMFYYNPNDSHPMVNDRVGMGTSMNLATPVGKAVMLLVAVLLLGIPFIGFAMSGIDDKPPVLVCQNGVIEATHGSSRYAVEIADVDSAQLLDDLPEGLLRVSGTSMENLLKGNFQAKSLGSVTVCLDPDCPPFLLIRTYGRKTYLFGARDAALTQSVFESIR